MVRCRQPAGTPPCPDRHAIRWPAERPPSAATARGFRTSWVAGLLVFGSDVVIIEGPVTVGTRLVPIEGLQHRRKPDGSKSGTAEFVGLARKMIHHQAMLASPSAGDGTALIWWHFEKSLKKYTYGNLSSRRERFSRITRDWACFYLRTRRLNLCFDRIEAADELDLHTNTAFPRANSGDRREAQRQPMHRSSVRQKVPSRRENQGRWRRPIRALHRSQRF